MSGNQKEEHHTSYSNSSKEVKNESCCGKKTESNVPKIEKKCCKSGKGGKDMQTGENIGTNWTGSLTIG